MSKVTYYRIINPSDRVHIASSDELAACIAVALISAGSMALRRDSDDLQVLPLWPDESWFQAHGIADTGEALDAYITQNRIAMAEALESVFYGDVRDMKALERTLEGLPDKAERKKQWNDVKRSSMTDIEHACLAYAAKLRMMEESKPRGLGDMQGCS